MEITYLTNRYMKKQNLLFVVGILFLTSFTFQQPSGNAIVDKMEGIDVYVNSRPLRDYTVIDSGITNVVMGQCDGMISKSVRKAVKDKADAVIIHFENFRYESIKYK
jgi:hypothetical protein